jgi:hypothetical protein
MFCGNPFVSIFRVGDYSFLPVWYHIPRNVILILTAIGTSKLTTTDKEYSETWHFQSPNILLCINFQYMPEIKN